MIWQEKRRRRREGEDTGCAMCARMSVLFDYSNGAFADILCPDNNLIIEP